MESEMFDLKVSIGEYCFSDYLLASFQPGLVRSLFWILDAA